MSILTAIGKIDSGDFTVQVTSKGQKQPVVHEHPYVRIIKMYLSYFNPRPEADDAGGQQDLTHCTRAVMQLCCCIHSMS